MAVVFSLGLLLGVAGCGDDDSGLAPGSEGGPCYSDGTCDGDLMCLSDLCVEVPCTEGSVRPCLCDGGEDGVAVCQADATWGECGCEADCGNGVVEPGEDCDGEALAGADCVSEGFEGGALACAGDCTFDTSACATCGDGVVSAAEECDGAALDGADCQSEGFDGGTLACAGDCTFDTSGCTACGDGILDAGEECDGAALGGNTCETLGLYGSGLACASDCSFDTSACDQCQEVTVSSLAIQLDMIVLLDRSGSMSGTSWTSSVNALTEFFNDPNSAGVGAALSVFPPDSGDECVASSYNPPHVPMGTLNGHASTLVTAMNAWSPTGLTPTYGALLGTLQYATAHKDLNPTHAVVVVLATDGDPTSCVTTIPNIAALAASAYNYNGVMTFAVAIQGASIANLNQIAQAGGGEAFDVTSDITLFKQKMDEIRTQANGCTYVLPTEAQSDPTNTNVNYTPGGGAAMLVPQADDLADCGSAPGWYYDDPLAPTQFYLCPATCTLVQNDPNGSIDLSVGCPTVLN